jgi:uroporphyrinogen decarboxylase
MTKIRYTHRERIEQCLSGGDIDRVPIALWRHFPVDDQSADLLAKATINYQETYDFDFVKVTPASSYCVRDWGSKDEWVGVTEGTRQYVEFPIKHPEDWGKLKILNPRKKVLGEHLKCLELIARHFGEDVPVIQTIFNPLSQAKNLVSREKLLVHLRLYPEALMEGLNNIAESTIDFICEARKTGIAGIFYAVQHAQYGLLSQSEYLKFGRDLDQTILQHLDNFWLNVLHLHGNDVMFDVFNDYPTNVINWHDRDTPPTLKDAKSRYSGVVCGGLRRETMVIGNQKSIELEAQDAIKQTGGTRFILGTGCVTPITAPHGNIMAARLAVEK